MSSVPNIHPYSHPLEYFRHTRLFIPKPHRHICPVSGIAKDRDAHNTTSQGTLKSATIAMNFIDFLIDLRHSPSVTEILDKEGGTLLDLIQRALHQYKHRR